MSNYGYFPPQPPPDPEPPKPKRRNARARYRLTAAGDDALQAYRAAVAAAQAGDGGRDALEKAQSSWAGSNGLESSDALVMGELDEKPQTILEMTRSLDTCGMKRPSIEAGIDRLAAQDLAEPATTDSGANNEPVSGSRPW